MFYKIVEKRYDYEKSVYYYSTVADIFVSAVCSLDSILKLCRNDFVLLECYPLSNECVFSIYNYVGVDFDKALEIR